MGILIAQIAFAGGTSSTQSGDIASLKRDNASLHRQIDQLQSQFATAKAAKKRKKKKRGPAGPQGPPGPQGATGPAGSAPACQGNGSGDTMVSAGAVCIDKYEVSVWSSPTGGTQYGASSDNYPCNDNGHDCTNIYARSIPGVTPSSHITWFQAQQALANVGKRLPSNAEWQQAVAGTPDSTACNVSAGVVASTGANAGCISRFGANDMVGNLDEWVGDWDEQPFNCTSWPAAYGSDFSCVGRSSPNASTSLPGALIRGGLFGDGTAAGPFAVNSRLPSDNDDGLGFRGVR